MKQIELYNEIFKLLSEDIKPLQDKPEETIELTLHALWLTAYGKPMPPEASKSVDLPTLNYDQINFLRDLVNKRISGTPLSYLTKRQRFFGLDFEVNSDVMIPRKETEILTRHALILLNSILKNQEKAIVVDTCTGCGNIAITIAYYQQNTVVFANDISERAIEVCNKNLHHLNMRGRVTFSAGNLIDPFLENAVLKGNVDIITCNPPYISTGKLKSLDPEIILNEPEQAFNGGPFGISILNRIINDGAILLRNGGWLCIEVGKGQGPGIIKKFQRAPQWGQIHDVKDDNGVVRVVSAQKTKI